ncbi:MAG: PLP-dependent aminotransferase family protein, partial [Anaerolineae bacterium]|nr:PLP-dependent aminotransferase family protein [Anaerolineae bacterium]
MRIPLDHSSDVPLYRQIEDYLRQNIRNGGLAAATRLPATRELAQELGVSRITVNNAYAELESDGLIYTVEGSGTYVAPPLALSTPLVDDTAVTYPLWQQDLTTNEVDDPELRGVIRPLLTPHPHPIAFTGVGDPHQFPLDDFFKSLKQVIQEEGITALAYGDMNGGYSPLRETVAHVLASQGIQANPAHILITAGSQQALALTCQVLLKPGDVILVEKPTYNFALELFRSLNLKIVGLPLDEHGMQVDLL